MPSDIIYSDDGERLTYFSKSHPDLSVSLSRDVVVEAAFLARDWYAGQGDPLYALQCGSFDYNTVSESCRAFARLANQTRARARYRTQDLDVDSLQTAHDALKKIFHPEFGED